MNAQCLSVQCIYCQQIRAKNTSRQRAHLLECNAYLDAMKDVNPDNSIIREAANHVNGTPTPSKTPGARSFQIPQAPSIQVPKPGLERDFRMSVRVNPKISVGPSIWGQRNWVTFIDGHWNGRWGKGTVVVSLLLTPDSAPCADAIDHSLVAKTRNSSPRTSQPTWKRLTSSRPPTCPQHTSQSKQMAGGRDRGKFWRNSLTQNKQTTWIHVHTCSGCTYIWRPGMRGIYMSIPGCGLVVA